MMGDSTADLTRVREILTTNGQYEGIELSHICYLLGKMQQPDGSDHSLIWDPKTASVREIERYQRA